jgi:CHASE1-domain containing sensor protein
VIPSSTELEKTLKKEREDMTVFQRLWNELLEKGPTNDDLKYVIRRVEPLRAEAWGKLLAQNPTNDDLKYVIEYVEPLRAEAWGKLLAQNPTNDDLKYVIGYVEPLRAEAGAILKKSQQRQTKDILAEMRAMC